MDNKENLSEAISPVTPVVASSSALRAGRNRTSFWIVAAALVSPLLPLRYLPLVDLPAHLARLHILHHYAENPAFQQRYQVVHQPVPYLALDVMTPLLAWLPMTTIAKIFVVLTSLLFAAGCALLSRSIHGVITPLAILAVFAEYNSSFFEGYVVFHFALAIYFIAFAFWLRWRDHWTPLRFLVFTLLTFAAYLAHLGGFVFLGLSLGFLSVLEWWRARRIVWTSILSLVPLAGPIFLYLFAHGPYGAAERTRWGSPALKLTHAFIPLLGYNGIVDITVSIALLVAAIFAIRAGKISFDPRIGALAIFFWITYVIFPGEIATGQDTDTRFVIVAVVFTLLAVRLQIPESAGRAAFLLALTALLLRVGYIGWVWSGEDRLMAQNVEFFNNIPIGARVYPIVSSGPGRLTAGLNQGKFERPLYHAISWATINRDAIVPTNFTIRGQHYVIERDGFWFREYYPDDSPDKFDWPSVFRNYDVVWYYGSDTAILRHLSANCQLIAENGKSHLFRVVMAGMRAHATEQALSGSYFQVLK
jgi:hypothetical protein